MASPVQRNLDPLCHRKFLSGLISTDVEKCHVASQRGQSSDFGVLIHNHCPERINLQTTRYVLHAAFETLSKNQCVWKMAGAMCLEDVPISSWLLYSVNSVQHLPVLLNYVDFIVPRLPRLRHHLPYIRPHMVHVMPYLDKLLPYVDLFEDHPQASANADVLTAYLGWVLYVPVLPRLLYLPVVPWHLGSQWCHAMFWKWIRMELSTLLCNLSPTIRWEQIW
eukprot:s117_g26.t1